MSVGLDIANIHIYIHILWSYFCINVSSLFLSFHFFCIGSNVDLRRPHVVPGSRNSLSLTLCLLFIIWSLVLISSCSSLSCFFSSQLSLLSLSLSLSFSFSHCCSELPLPYAAGVVRSKPKRELLRKHLWFPPSLWLCSLPIFTSGSFQVMNEKWQYSHSDLKNRLVGAFHWQLETSYKCWMQVLGCIQPSCFLFLCSKASFKENIVQQKKGKQ